MRLLKPGPEVEYRGRIVARVIRISKTLTPEEEAARRRHIIEQSDVETETDWWNRRLPMCLLDFVRGKASHRSLRLFTYACCRRFWHLLDDEDYRKTVTWLESYADAECDEEERDSMAQRIGTAEPVPVGGEPGSEHHWVVIINGQMFEIDLGSPPQGGKALARAAVRLAVLEDAFSAAMASYQCAAEAVAYSVADRDTNHEAWCAAMQGEYDAQVKLLWDIFGNPFQPVTPDPAWLTPRVIEIAQTNYDSRAFHKMPELADVLQEAGCTGKSILDHCRQPNDHVRGCWVVDLLLDKEKEAQEERMRRMFEKNPPIEDTPVFSVGTGGSGVISAKEVKAILEGKNKRKRRNEA